ARVEILDVDLADMNVTGFHRVHDLGDGRGYTSTSCELSGVQFGDGIEDRQHEMLKCAVLDAEVQCWTKRVRAFFDQPEPDLFLRALKSIQALRYGLQLGLLGAAIPTHFACRQASGR